jgi:hypothetical protein
LPATFTSTMCREPWRPTSRMNFGGFATDGRFRLRGLAYIET